MWDFSQSIIRLCTAILLYIELYQRENCISALMSRFSVLWCQFYILKGIKYSGSVTACHFQSPADRRKICKRQNERESHVLLKYGEIWNISKYSWIFLNAPETLITFAWILRSELQLAATITGCTYSLLGLVQLDDCFQLMRNKYRNIGECQRWLMNRNDMINEGDRTA